MRYLSRSSKGKKDLGIAFDLKLMNPSPRFLLQKSDRIFDSGLKKVPLLRFSVVSI